MCLHLKFLDIDHPLTFEVRKLIFRQIEAHGLIYLSTENFETLSYIMWHYHFESSYQAICLILSTYLILGMHIMLPKVITLRKKLTWKFLNAYFQELEQNYGTYFKFLLIGEINFS